MLWIHRLFLACILCTFSLPLAGQEVEVDTSACRGVYAALKAMHDGAHKNHVEAMHQNQHGTRQ